MNRHSSLPAPGTSLAAPVSASHGGWVVDWKHAWIISVVIGLMIVYTTVDPGLGIPIEERKFDFSANIFTRLIKLAVLAVGFVVCLWRLKLGLVFLRWLNPAFAAFMVLVPLSALWSISRGDTIARFVSITSMVMICVAFTLSGWRTNRIQDVLRPWLTFLIVASFAYVAIKPELGIEQGAGTLHNAWRGVTSQKNQFGQLASFAAVFWLHAVLYRQTRLLHALLFGTASLACVFLSRSSTSLLATVFSVAFMLMLFRTPQNLRRYMPYIVAGFATLLVIYATAVLKIVPGLDVLLTPVTAFTGKDLTFSNRSEIWVIIKEHIQLSPWIGSGYGAYWTGFTGNSPSIVFLTRMYFYPGESHNGYLEITNDLGFIGLLILLAYLIYYVRQSLQLMKFNRSQGVLYLSLFFQQAILNLSGSSWLCVNNGFAFFIMTLATMCLARTLLDQRLQQIFGPAAMTNDRRSRGPR